MQNSYFYLAAKTAAAIISAILVFDTADTGVLIIRMLVFGCLFALQLLLSLINGGVYKKWSLACELLVIGGIFLIGIEEFFLLLVVAGMELLDSSVKGSMFYEIGAVVLLLLWVVYAPTPVLQLFTAVFILFLLLLRYVEDRRRSLWESNVAQKEYTEQLKKKLEDMKVYSRTVQETAIAEERNRFASRIHDQLGHNISGSIILLEATAMMLGTDAQDAVQKNLALVTENLRRGVDDIRGALKEERPGKSRLGIHEVKKQLEEFQITYNRRATLSTEGDLEKISIPLWICIRDNLKEALTNMLKHSEGTAFTLQIKVMNKAVRVEYADNGKCSAECTPGMGLSAIEERTAACGGTTLVTGGQNGFRIVTVFL